MRREARLARECGTRVRSGAADGYTTPRHKTHNTLLGDEMVVAYEWHPWTGRSVRVHKVIETTQGAAARCDLAHTQTIRFLEIPVWMLDPVACRSMRAAAQPVAALSALTALRAFLSEAMAHAAASSSGEAVGSRDHHRGDRHAAPPSSAPDAEPSTRPLSVQPATDAGNDVGMEYPAGSNPAGADRADDPLAGRPCRRRGARVGERRR